jgi:3-deoxy-D-manno-octulosonic-acid transferase
VANVRPKILVLTELELWPNLVAQAKASGAHVAVVNGRLSDKSFRGYRRVHWIARRVLEQLDVVAVQTDEYADRFLALGARLECVCITGSVKFDGASTKRNNPATERLKRSAGISAEDVVFLAGSTQAPEESLALDAFERIIKDDFRLRLILVPRHPERFDEVAALLDRRGIAWQRRSRLDASQQAPASNVPRVLLVDVVGELGAWWGTADIAFVGGSLTSRGGQNMIEPAAYGAAVSFGPNTWNFKDVVSLLLSREAAVIVHSRAELEAFVLRCLTEPAWAAALGERAQALVLEQQGAADRTIALLGSLLQPETTPLVSSVRRNVA